MAQAPAKPELMLETVTTSEETLIRCIRQDDIHKCRSVAEDGAPTIS